MAVGSTVTSQHKGSEGALPPPQISLFTTYLCMFILNILQIKLYNWLFNEKGDQPI